MIITGDSEPVKGLSESYNFRSAASALILQRSDSKEGFQLIKNYSYPQFRESFQSYITWKRKNGRLKKKNLLLVEQSDSYLKECLECSLKSLESFLSESRLNLNDIDLIIPSQSPAGFVHELDNRLGNQSNLVLVNGNGRGELHTSGPSFALRKAWDDGTFEKAENILFLTVGAGISNTIAWYSKQGGDTDAWTINS